MIVTDRIGAGSPQLRRLSLAMACAGLAAFAMLYSTQASLPAIGATFGVGATAASLTVSVSTGMLALTVLPMSALAERFGRVRVMTAGLAVATASVALGSLTPDLPLLLLTRAVDGISLGAVVAVAMGHIGAEVHESASAAAIGVYVSATSLGGLAGRLIPAGVDAFGGWRGSLVAIAILGALCTVVFARIVPAAHAVERTNARMSFGPLLRDPGVVRLCLVGMLAMGGFVGTYNFLTYRLADRPFDLSPAEVGLVFLAYLAGTVSSTAATRSVMRAGRRSVLLVSILVALVGLVLTLPGNLVCVLIGLVVFTTGFFGVHAVASGWVTVRVPTNRSQASALYLLGYYLGSSVGGSIVGVAWTAGGWPATVVTVGACYLLAALAAVGIRGGPDVRDATAAGAGSPAARSPSPGRRTTAPPHASR